MKTYLDGSKHGVIYMSFGTNVNPSQLPADRIALFNKVFSKLPYDVVWKWDKDSMPGKADNVKIVKWVPQSDLLRKKIFFITYVYYIHHFITLSNFIQSSSYISNCLL